MNHDIIAIGGSAGALKVLLGLVEELPGELPASIFVVVHTSASSGHLLPELLSARGRMPAHYPTHGERIVQGKIYVAPPDNHLLVRTGAVEVVRGPKENGKRPAVDALFRTAAAVYGARVVGVVLSGYQDCGTAGLMSINARGGVSVAQAPETATAPEMPRSAIQRADITYVVHPRELPGLIVNLASTPASPPRKVADGIRALEGNAPGMPVEVTCPLCQGVLSEAQLGKVEHFRCHVGHTFSLESLVREQSEEMERALWAAVRALEESAALSARLSTTETTVDLQRRFAEKASTQADQANAIRSILLHGNRLSTGDAEKIT